MKTIVKHFLFLTVSLIFINCSIDNEIIEPDALTPNSEDSDIPMELLSDNGALEIPGFPMNIKKYQNGDLYYWAHYSYRPDGNLLKVSYSHKGSSSEIFTNTYHYDTQGKLIKLDGHDVYNFYWDDERIVEADRYNGMWSGRSKIFYGYNTKGQLIQKLENNLDFLYSEKIIYTYFEDGNLKTIEQYADDSESGVIKLYSVTTFEGYNADRNLFLELEIIPGQSVQHQFPTAMDFKHHTDSSYNISETYEYKYDSEGRVIEKIFGNNKVVYQYY